MMSSGSARSAWRRVAAALRRAALALLVMVAAAGLAPDRALAVDPSEVLSDPLLESRARSISAGVRCMVCQNQSIDDSNAPLARDLRVLVRERLKAGDSDDAVRDYLVARYGDFVLLRPPLNLGTILLWLMPLLLLVVAVTLAARQLVGRGSARDVTAEPPLSSDEARRLDELLQRRE